MTYDPYTRSPYWVPSPPRPPQPPPRRSHTKAIAIVAAGLATVGLSGLAIFGLLNSGGGTTTSTTTSAPPGSNQDDWFKAVCKTGTVDQGLGGNMVPNADQGTAMCQSQSMGYLFFGLYSSDYMARNDAQRLHMGSFATLVTDSGHVQIVLTPSDNTGPR